MRLRKVIQFFNSQKRLQIASFVFCLALLVIIPLFFLWYKTYTAAKIQTPISTKEIVPPHVPGQLIVNFKDGEVVENFIKTAPKEFGFIEYTKVFPKETTSALKNYYLLKFSQQENIEVIKAYVQQSPEVRSVEFNKIMSFDADPLANDPLYTAQWALKTINIDKAWEISNKTNNVIVGVIDSGIDYNHEDLNSNQVIKGGNFVTNDDSRVYGKDGDPMDIFGHGTAIAGIIGATTNNNKGIAGVFGLAKNTQLLAIKAGGINGSSQYDSLQAINSAITDGKAKVINMSFGMTGSCSDSYQALFNAHKDVVFVAAAGNGLCKKNNEETYVDPDPLTHRCPLGTTKTGVNINTSSHDPASCKGVISVASVDSENKRATSSNWGTDLAAPGVGILTTRSSKCSICQTEPNTDNKYKYDSFNGTSFAAPYAAGATAMLLAKYPNLTSDQVKECLVKNGTTISGDQHIGPLLNVGDALKNCSDTPPTPTPSISTTPKPTTQIQTPTPSPVVTSVVRINDNTTPVGNTATSGRIICSPVGGMDNKLNSNAIQVTNGTDKDIPIWFQNNLCDYTQGISIVEGYQCNTFKGRANYTLSKGQTKTFTLDIPPCTVGQLDINVVNPGDKGCYRSDDTDKLWDGGLAFAIQANKTGCNTATTPTPIRTRTLDSAGFLRDGSVSIPTPTPRTCTQPQVKCTNNDGSAQICSFTCI